MMRRLKALRLVVSHTQLYRKLDEYGQDYDASVKNMMKQECDWMKSQHVPLSMNDEEIVETQSSDESFTESHTAEVSQLPCRPSGQKLTIDNIDFRQQVHYMTQEHQVIDQHYLTVCSTNNRVHGNHLSSLHPVEKLKSMENGKCIPNNMDQVLQRENYIHIVERILVHNIPCLELFKNVIVNHIPHMYSKETREPTNSVSTT